MLGLKLNHVSKRGHKWLWGNPEEMGKITAPRYWATRVHGKVYILGMRYAARVLTSKLYASKLSHITAVDIFMTVTGMHDVNKIIICLAELSVNSMWPGEERTDGFQATRNV